MSDTYKTITTPAEGIYKEKGSKFLSFAHPVSSVDEVKEWIKEYRKRFFDARHVCYAYVIGPDKAEFRANDDGEPSGTAGRPILGQINSNDLTNVLVVVIRYFGGILLGTGGLIVAYKEACADALGQAEIVERIVEETVFARFDYILTNEVMRVAKDTGARIANQTYGNDCMVELSVRKDDADILRAKLGKIYGVTIVEN